MTRRRPTDDGGSTAGLLSDIDGLLVGHSSRTGVGWRSGTTVIVAPEGVTAGVDVRGGGPGTHETDLLRPENLVERVHAICLTGGSAFGLAAATGVMEELESRGIGFPVGSGSTETVVPIVPAAVIFDLGRGGQTSKRPDTGFGALATRAAFGRRRHDAAGSFGAGTGAVAGGLQGGVGQTSIRLADGTSVAALAVVNAVGSVIDPTTGLPWERGSVALARPTRVERLALQRQAVHTRSPLNTVIGVVATDAVLTKAECTRLAMVAHDGLSRAVRPAHTLFDGDTVFGLATGRQGERGASGRDHALHLNAVFEAGAQCFARACTDAVVLARSHRGGPPSYRDLCPSAFPPGI